jgi:O-antigen/teichoic acid export membrane protein
MLRHIFEAIGRRFLASAFSLTASSFLAHELGVTHLGQYAGMVALGQLAIMAFAVGLDISPIYLLRNHGQHARSIWLLSTVLAAGAASFCACVGLALQAATNAGLLPVSTVTSWGALPFLYAASTILMTQQLSCLQGLLRLTVFNVLQVAYPLGFLIYLVAARSWQGLLTPEVALTGWLVVSLLLAVGGALLMHRFTQQSERAGQSWRAGVPLKAFFTFSRDAYLSNLVGTVNSRLPALLAAALLAPVAASQFAAVSLASDIFSFFSLAIGSVSFAVLSAPMAADERMRSLTLACRINTTLTLLAIMVLLAFFDPLTKLLLGAEIATPALWPPMVLALACVVFHSTARLLCTDLSAQGRPLLNALPNIPAALVFLSVFFGLLHAGLTSAWVAVGATASASFTFSVLAFILHRRSSNVGLTSILLLRCDDLLHCKKWIESRLGRDWPRTGGADKRPPEGR